MHRFVMGNVRQIRMAIAIHCDAVTDGPDVFQISVEVRIYFHAITNQFQLGFGSNGAIDIAPISGEVR